MEGLILTNFLFEDLSGAVHLTTWVLYLFHFKGCEIIYIHCISMPVLAFVGSHIFSFLILTEFACFNMFASNSETALAKILICLYMFESAFYLHS